MADSIRVISYPDPLHEPTEGRESRTLYAIWDGDRPILYANTFLRSFRNKRPNTRRTIATNLLPFVRYVERNHKATGRSFWDPQVRLTGLFTEFFRNTLDSMREYDEISDETARAYLDAAFLLCRWWRQPGEPEIGEEVRRRNRGAINYAEHTIIKRPAEWTLEPLIFRQHADDEEKTLTLDHIEAVWAYLRDDRRPRRPKILQTKVHPTWSEAKQRRHEQAKRSWDYRMGLYRRNLAIWAVMMSSGARIAEVPLLTLEDILTHNEVLGAKRGALLSPEEYAENEDKLWLDLRYRESTRKLGTLKRGGRKVYIGWEERTTRAIREWLPQRTLVMARTAERHDSLFTNDDGKPLTQRAIRRLFANLRAEFEKRGDLKRPPMAGGARRRRRSGMYPHLVRHTLETIMRSNGVDLYVQQRQLGHESARSTDKYGTIFEERMRESLDRFTRRLASLGEDQR